ncbi:MAG: hypothetical protein J7K36_10265 [Archaeoglobaceae archaeon]|nr:hypothetical protein [Archaeoglobaceae archaeon]HDD36835.1 hypothetical protein [Archaeoglobus veneficus]
MVSVRLKIKNHCIETAAKKKYNELVSYLIKEDNPEKEKELDIILNFLKKADFRKLRKQGYDGSVEKIVEIFEDGSVKEVVNENCNRIR